MCVGLLWLLVGKPLSKRIDRTMANVVGNLWRDIRRNMKYPRR